MKLAEGLMQRSDCQTRLSELKDRIVRNARYQEGDKPCEDPKHLLAELDSVVEQLESLIRRINKTNSLVEICSVGTITDALARRDVLGKKIYILHEVAKAGTATYDRFSRTELKNVSAVDVPDLQRQADLLSREWRDLDLKIQSANWSAELL